MLRVVLQTCTINLSTKGRSKMQHTIFDLEGKEFQAWLKTCPVHVARVEVDEYGNRAQVVFITEALKQLEEGR